VGDEWAYRSYIEGGTLAACVWTFDGITEEAFPHGLPVEMTIEVFRTYKGNIEKGVLGSLAVRNPRTGKKVEVRIFESKEFMTDSQLIPRELQMPDGKKVDLFKDSWTTGRSRSGCNAWRHSSISGRHRRTCTFAPATPPSR